jgi:hypothetical protein
MTSRSKRRDLPSAAHFRAAAGTTRDASGSAAADKGSLPTCRYQLGDESDSDSDDGKRVVRSAKVQLVLGLPTRAARRS